VDGDYWSRLFGRYLDTDQTLEWVSWSSSIWANCMRSSDHRPVRPYYLAARNDGYERNRRRIQNSGPQLKYWQLVGARNAAILEYGCLERGAPTVTPGYYVDFHATNGYLIGKHDCTYCLAREYISYWRP
jgi:hypothetical protein